MNTPKLQLHIEQLFLKTAWRLAERLFYNEDHKEKVQWDRKGREAIWLGPTALVGDPERRTKSQAWGASLRSRGFSPTLDTLAQGSSARKLRLLGWFWKPAGLTRGCRKPRLYCYSMRPELLAAGPSTEASVWKAAGALDHRTETTIVCPPSLLGALAANAPQERTCSSRWTAAHTPPASAPPPPSELTSSTPRSSHGSYLILAVATTPDSNLPSPKWQSQHILEKAWPK